MTRFIAVAGNMGAGKTSLVRYLHQRYGFRPVYEPFADNPYLDDFYADMRRWAFHSQLYFLTHKFRLHTELTRASGEGTAVLDRTIYEDAEIFARNLARGRYMSAREHRTYTELYEAMRESLPPPDLLIYLRCDVRSIRRRIRQRGRPAEQRVPARYIRRINELYEAWIARYDLSPVMIWDSGRQDYLSHLVDHLDFHRAIERFLG